MRRNRCQQNLFREQMGHPVVKFESGIWNRGRVFTYVDLRSHDRIKQDQMNNYWVPWYLIESKYMYILYGKFGISGYNPAGPPIAKLTLRVRRWACSWSSLALSRARWPGSKGCSPLSLRTARTGPRRGWSETGIVCGSREPKQSYEIT